MKKYTLLTIAFAALGFTANSQCSFSGLDSVYCANDAAVTIVPSGAGDLSGPGITGTTFDPAAAGPGTHVISYFEPGGDPNMYSVSQNGVFAPVAGSGTPVTLSDDQVSAALPIGFTFTFFGVDYTDFYISSNGFMTFSNNGDNGCCSGDLLPNGTTPDNLIAFGWSDMYPPGNGTIEYFTVGTAPDQMLVMNFTDIPFCCDNTPQLSTQVILYETSNMIEIHTSYSNDFFTGTQGIENAGGTIAFTTPGRNAFSWSAFTNDYVAFIPGCAAQQEVTVLPSPSISLSSNDEIYGNDGSVNLTLLTGSAPFMFDWSNDGIGDNDDSNDLYGVPSGVYSVTVTDASGCSVTDSIMVGSQVGLTELSGVDFSIEPNPSTGIFNVNISNFEIDQNLHLLIVNTLGQRVLTEQISGDKTTIDISNVEAGTYFVKIVSEKGTSVRQIVKK